jgi:hypothetical protein
MTTVIGAFTGVRTPSSAANSCAGMRGTVLHGNWQGRGGVKTFV